MLVIVLFAALGLMVGNHMANRKRTMPPPVQVTTAPSPGAATQP
jgi:hypothetical protein